MKVWYTCTPENYPDVTFEPPANVHPSQYAEYLRGREYMGATEIWTVNPLFLDMFEPENVWSPGYTKNLAELLESPEFRKWKNIFLSGEFISSTDNPWKIETETR